MEDKSIPLIIVEDYKKSNKRKDIMIFVLLGIISLFVLVLSYIFTNYDFSIEDNYADTYTGNACIGENCNNGDDYNGDSLQQED